MARRKIGAPDVAPIFILSFFMIGVTLVGRYVTIVGEPLQMKAITGFLGCLIGFIILLFLVLIKKTRQEVPATVATDRVIELLWVIFLISSFFTLVSVFEAWPFYIERFLMIRWEI